MTLVRNEDPQPAPEGDLRGDYDIDRGDGVGEPLPPLSGGQES